jgi:hypothetical protein
MTRLGKKLLILPAWTMLCIAAGKDAAPFRTKPAAEYSNNMRQEGLRLGAEAYTSAEQTKPPFGKLNPNDHGVLPILVVMHNEGKNVIKLDGLKVEYVDAQKRHVINIPASQLPYLKSPDRPKVSANPIPPIFQRKKKNELAAPELDQRGFAAKMLPPGESAHGFFYFQSTHEPGAMLYLTGMVNAASGQEMFYFEVPLDPK